MLKYAHSSVDIGNHRYTNVQNCILLKYKCNKKCPPPSENIPTALLNPLLLKNNIKCVTFKSK